MHPKHYLVVTALCLSMQLSTSSLQAQEIQRATATKTDDVAIAFIKEHVAPSRGLLDTWVNIENASNRPVFHVTIEYFTCDGEHGKVEFPSWNEIPPGTAVPTVDTTKKITKFRILWITKFLGFPIPHVSQWKSCDPGQYAFDIDLVFDPANKVTINTVCYPCP